MICSTGRDGSFFAMAVTVFWTAAGGKPNMVRAATASSNTSLWSAFSVLPTEEPELAAQFQAAYEESVQWVLDHPAEAATLAEEYLGMKAAIVEAAIPNMGLTFKSAQDAKEELDTFYNLLYNFEPSMIGGKLPDEGLFYAG